MASKEKKTKESGFRGISLNLSNTIMACIGVVVAVLMIYANVQTNKNYQLMDEVITESLLSQEATGKMESISSSMSGSAQAFVDKEKDDASQIYAYVGQRAALNAEFSESGMLSAERQAEDPDLALAVQVFNTLRETEWKAMRLKAEAMGMPLPGMPEAMQQVQLTEAEAAMSAEEKRTAAFEMLSTPEYMALRSQLAGAVDSSHRFVSERASARTAEASAQLGSVVRRQKILIIIFIVVAFLALIMNRVLVLQPINRSVDALDRRERIPVRGSAEIRHLARVYNDVLEDNREKTEALSYTATHDALTGVNNRAAFDKAYRLYRDGRIGVAVVDVDQFKHYNDDYGHDIGDRVLVRVAEALKRSFREEDIISRIGGDEFCVIMKDTGMAQADRVYEAVRRINASLAEPEEGLPPITISVGAAFWDRPNPTAGILKDADTALLEIKKEHTANCAVYGEALS